MKKWIIGNPDPKLSSELVLNGGLSEICAGVLVSRGIDTLEKAQNFFNYSDNSGGIELSDPFLIKGMNEAADYIQDAVENGKRICIYGDYDCDGITATAVLYQYIECMGGNVCYHINMRADGYGLCESAVRLLCDEGVELIITVDNGISAVNEAALINELGMELIITDHHQPGDNLPEALAIVNPHRLDCMSPYKDLCGCGVVLKLIAAMDGGDYSAVFEQFSDLAAIATIADIVPLNGENREIVRHGLRYLENTENIGLKALIECAGVNGHIDSSAAAFRLIPRINAAGRFGSASDAVRLLLCEDPEEAEEIAREIDALNNQRKLTETSIINEIEEIIADNPGILYGRVLVFYGKGWHHGVIGIIAARITERFGKPVFIMSDEGDEARGSARSVKGFSIHKALTACSRVLTKFGGHKGAGGFSLPITNIPEFIKCLQEYSKSNFDIMPVYSLKADKIISPEELKKDTINSLNMLEPFGEGNNRPLFAMLSVRILDVISLSNGQHTKLKLTYGKTGLYGLLFGTKTADFSFKAGDMLDMLVYPEVNNYNGSSNINIRIADYRKSGISQQKYLAAKNVYEQYMRGEIIDNKLIQRIIPARDELAQIYKALPKSRFISCDAVYSGLDTEQINYCKFRLALNIFEELGLLEINKFQDCLKLSQEQKKVQLDNSIILSKLNSLVIPALY